jgi:hypothetical protein
MTYLFFVITTHFGYAASVAVADPDGRLITNPLIDRLWDVLSSVQNVRKSVYEVRPRKDHRGGVSTCFHSVGQKAAAVIAAQAVLHF